ncbi:hypothetical protein CYMTET_15194 [Cymbomonas tetramitiformis]|uniref:Uncharacterized protein n=1 Tax=Cymbomonas tetramitiformis TaxID=36881 RepID=A0AAE0GER4_9CHLO|nr:hypothetical protein CYMTET_15194 [Cymbomonas tetramitiformis]
MASTSTDDPPVAMAQRNDDEEERTEMWEGQAVPFPVFKALSTAYRGQHIGPEGLKVLANPGVPDEVKLELCKKAYAKSAKEWLDAYETRKRKAASLDEETFLHAEMELIDESNPAALRRSQRQSVLDARTVDTIEKKEVTVLNFLLATFFLACAIPWAVVENPFFRAFIKALRPAYYDFLPKRDQMRTTMLDEVYEEALESTAARLKSKPGKKTLGLDGKTNIRGRGTINVTECKQGINTYVKTVYCAIVAVFGKTQLRRYDEAFTVENVQAAILNWNGGKNDSRYARLLAEYEKYSGRVGDYSSKLTTAENIVRTRLAKDVLPTITAEDKENKAMHLLRVLQGLCKISLAPTFWASIENSSTATPDCILFCKMAIECHMVVPHAIGVERVNKNADIVHCKRRASMGEITSVKAIYAYSNLYLEFEGKHTFDRFCEEVMSREEIESMYDGFEDVVDATAPNLPAVDNSDSSEDEDASADEEYGESLLEDDEDEWEEEPLEVPEGFTALPLPVALLQGKDLQHVHVLMKWEGTGWQVGKVVRIGWDGLARDAYVDGVTQAEGGRLWESFEGDRGSESGGNSAGKKTVQDVQKALP